jgi:Ca-activated chloride channel family protein
MRMKHSVWLALGPALLGTLLGCSSSGDLAGEDDSAPAAQGPGKHSDPGGSSIGATGNIAIGSTAGTTSSGGGAAAVGSAGKTATAGEEPMDASASGGEGSVDTEEPRPILPANPFVITEHDPLSTFAADVDTASYDIFTSSVSTGSLPPAATVRLEEFVNYFHYDYQPPAADAAQPFSISLAAAPALDPSTLLFRVGIQGRMPTLEKRPANLVFLVDTSGSMAAQNKLPLVQYTLTKALTVLDATDEISIVTYAGSTKVELAPTPVAQAGTIKAVINGLNTNGGTNGSSGIKLAYQQARAGYIEGGVNHVLLCTDGDFNLGLTANEDLVELITQERESGVTLTALGYGAASNDEMMEKVSNAGNGTYSVVYSQESADSYVEGRLLGNLEYIAKDMKLQVEFNPAKVYAYRLLGYEDREIADGDFRNDVVDAGEVGAGHRVTALYQLVLAGGAIPLSSTAPAPEDGALYSGPTEVGAEDYALVKVRYKAPDAGTTDEASEVNQTLGATGVADSWSALDADFQWAYAVASFAEILKDSPYATKSAINTIGNIIGQPVHDGVAEREQFRTSFAKAKTLLP